MTQEKERKCNQCKQFKPLSLEFFAKGGISNKGFSPYCKVCGPKAKGKSRANVAKRQAVENGQQLIKLEY